MAKWKVGDIVRHRATGEKVMILYVRSTDEYGLYVDPQAQIYVVRLPNYTKTDLLEYELESDTVSTKIKD